MEKSVTLLELFMAKLFFQMPKTQGVPKIMQWWNIIWTITAGGTTLFKLLIEFNGPPPPRGTSPERR